MLIGVITTAYYTSRGYDEAKDSQQREFDQQKEMLDLQNQFSEDMWEKNNEYNTPAEQMFRGIEAGINPNALAQGIAGAPTFGQQVQSSQTPSVNPLGGVLGSLMSNFGSSINGSLNAGLDQMMELRKQNSEIDVNKSLADLYSSQKGNTDAKTFYQKVLNDFVEEHQNAVVRKAIADANVSEENARIYKSDADVRDDLNRLKLSELESTISNLDQQLNNLVQDFRLKMAEYDKIVQEIKESEAREGLSKEQQLTEQTKRNNLNSQSWYQDMVNQIFQATGIDPTKDAVFAKFEKLLIGDPTDSDNYDPDKVQQRVKDAMKYLEDMKSFKIATESLVKNREYSNGLSGDLIKFIYQLSRTSGRILGNENMFGEAGN